MLYCPNFCWNVLQVWMTGKDVYLQMTWSWPDKTWNILCSYCLQWNTSQSKFRNHYFLFLFAFSILSQLFLIWGCIYGNAQIEDSLIGINEGIEELTLTLLIGIKADLLQFILYPDKLLKWSNSLIILETETSKWSKYKIISSAYNEILWLWSWILIDTSDFLIAQEFNR